MTKEEFLLQLTILGFHHPRHLLFIYKPKALTVRLVINIPERTHVAAINGNNWYKSYDKAFDKIKKELGI